MPVGGASPERKSGEKKRLDALLVERSLAPSREKAQALILAAVVPGGLLAFALLAVAGAALSRRRLVISGAIGILAETIVVFTIAPLTLIIGVSLLFLSRRVHSDP